MLHPDALQSNEKMNTITEIVNGHKRKLTERVIHPMKSAQSYQQI